MLVRRKKVVFVGDLRLGRSGKYRAEAVERCGFDISRIDTSMLDQDARFPRVRRVVNALGVRCGYHLDLIRLSETTLTEAVKDGVDVLWLDKALHIRPSTLRRIRNSNKTIKIVFYHPDDFKGRFNWCRSLHRWPDLIDLIATTKSYNVTEYQALGFRKILFVNNSFDPYEHSPPNNGDTGAKRYAFDIGFIGGYEGPRARAIRALAERGLVIHVAGSFWRRAGRLPAGVVVNHSDLIGPEYSDRIFHTKINLAFLRKQNRDLQTQRSVEIPACHGFMLSERTAELTEMFREAESAEFFGDIDELHHKCLYYLANGRERERIARNGFVLMQKGEFSTDSIVQNIMNATFEERRGRERRVRGDE